MNREIHVRFSEGLGVRFPWATRHVLGFERREDAERVLRVLPKRFGRYGLSLHPDKTRLVPFGRPITRDGRMRDGQSPGTFDFLGFTHYWGRSRKGRWILMRKTAKDRLSRGLKSLSRWCKRNRHRKLREQHAAICRKLRGHDAHYGITGNARSLRRFRWASRRIWRKWLNRRSRRPSMSWERFSNLLRDHLPLPPARVAHSIYAANP